MSGKCPVGKFAWFRLGYSSPLPMKVGSALPWVSPRRRDRCSTGMLRVRGDGVKFATGRGCLAAQTSRESCPCRTRLCGVLNHVEDRNIGNGLDHAMPRTEPPWVGDADPRRLVLYRSGRSGLLCDHCHESRLRRGSSLCRVESHPYCGCC